jgi:hypothetical protein
MFRDQPVYGLGSNERLIRQNDKCRLGVRIHGGEACLQGRSHALPIVLVHYDPRIVYLDLASDYLCRRAKNKHDFPYIASANVVQDMLQ